MTTPIDHLFDEDYGLDWDELEGAEFDAVFAAVYSHRSERGPECELFTPEDLPF